MKYIGKSYVYMEGGSMCLYLHCDNLLNPGNPLYWDGDNWWYCSMECLHKESLLSHT